MHLSNAPKPRLSDEVLNELSNTSLDSATLTDRINEVVNDKFTFSINHSVRIINDTCYDESLLDNSSGGVHINLTDTYKIYYKGKRLNSKNNDTTLFNKIIAIHPTGKIKTILQYACENYISTDSTYNIWFCKTLPNSINPGLTNLSEYPGAILSSEIIGKSATGKIEVTEIKIIR